MTTYYVETGSLDPYYNLAYEEFLLTHKTEGNIVMLWQNDNTVVVGLNQNAVAEINSEFVSAHGVKVVRRTTGGGAVYHDLGNLNYSFITDGDKQDLTSLSAFSAPVIKALAIFNVIAVTNGRNDIIVDGKKVSGTAQRIYKNRILHHGTLLFSSNAQMITNALNVDKLKYSGKSTQSVATRVGNIIDYMPGGVTLTQFWDALKVVLAEGAERLILTDSELAEVEKLANEKYRTWQWNFGKSPKFAVTKKARYTGGTVEAHISVNKGGVIGGVEFFGDYMARTSADDLVTALIGVQYTRDKVKNVLQKFDIDNIFGSITIDEILDVMF